MTAAILVLNAGSSGVKSSTFAADGRRPSAWVIPTDEEPMIARHAPQVCGASAQASAPSR